MTTTSADAASRDTASASSNAEPAGSTLIADLGSTAASRLQAIRVTSAPRAAATSARATPCLPEDRLPRKRTGSRGSRVPPAVTRTRTPVNGIPGSSSEAATWAAPPPRVAAAATASASAAISAGSGSRPRPVSAPVSRPDAGSMTWAPRARNVATLAWVAGCSHISVCMAGAKTTGHRAVSRVAVSRSSARPHAAFASRSAVAGATTTRSACCPIRTCGTWSTPVHTSLATDLPESAAQVGAPTNSRAAAVGTTVTS